MTAGSAARSARGTRVSRTRSIITRIASGIALTLVLSGCASGGGEVDPAVAAQFPHEHSIEVRPPKHACEGTVTMRGTSSGWQEWPPATDQIRLDAPEGEPQWYAVINALCSERDQVLKEEPELSWTLDGALSGLGDACAEAQPVQMPGWEAALCSGAPEGKGFTSRLVAVNDDYFLELKAMVRAERGEGSETTPGDLTEATPMIQAGEELLLHARVDLRKRWWGV